MKAAKQDTAGLPAFVIERNTRAVNAGLTITKQRRNGWELSSAYEGDAEAFIKAGFVRDVDAFRKAVASPVKHFNASHWYMFEPSPVSWRPSASLYRADGGRLRVTITREPVSKREWRVNRNVNGYEVFFKSSGWAEVYTATRLDLLANLLPPGAWEKVANNPEFHRWDDVRGRYDSEREEWTSPRYPVWELERDPEARLWRLTVFPSNAQKAQREDRHAGKCKYKSPDEYRSRLHTHFEMFGRVSEDLFSVVTRYGKQYTLDHAAVERLQLILSEALNIVATAPIHASRDPDLVAEDEAKERAQRELHAKLKEAGQDVELQSFLAKVVPLKRGDESR